MRIIFSILALLSIMGCYRSDTTISPPTGNGPNPPVVFDPAYIESNNGYFNATSSGGYKVKVIVGENVKKQTLNASGGYKVKLSIQQ